MPVTNDFLIVSTAMGNNAEAQITYAGSAEQLRGWTDGEIPPANRWNKMLRQASSIAALLSQAICNITGLDMLDNGDSATQLANFMAAIAGRTGQCRLTATSAVLLTLAPYNGNLLSINGAPQVIPSAGVTLSNAGLAANTLYYIYAFMNAGVMTLEASATGHSTGTNGIEIKTADATRSLVGMIYTSNNTPGQFVDSITRRLCVNWYSRLPTALQNTNAGSPSINTSGATQDVTPTDHPQFLVWANSSVSFNFACCVKNNHANRLMDSGMGLDGVGTTIGAQMGVWSVVADQFMPASCSATIVIAAEGLHYATVIGSVDVGDTGTWGPYLISAALAI